MRIYFSAAIYLKEKYGKNYEKIIQVLELIGHNVEHSHITEHSLEYVFSQSDNELKEYYRMFAERVRNSDIVVIEASFPSSVNIGHEITLALTKGKPVIVLYQNNLKPSMLVSIENDNLICVEYSLENLKNVLENALDYISGQMDVRFNLFLSSKMSQYLDKISQEEKVSKSHFIRSLIRKHMQENTANTPAQQPA